MKRITFIFLLTCLLQGCIFVAGAAAGAAAIAVVYDHRPFKETVEDTKLTNNIVSQINRIPDLKNECHIDVTVFNNIVLLTGEAPKAEWKEQAGDIANSAPNVTKVYNQITIQGPTSSLTRTSDTWITTKVKSMMLADEGLKTNSSSIKVVTENGVVYLMGIVTHPQADTAVDIARQVAGVQKVIKIFQYK